MLNSYCYILVILFLILFQSYRQHDLKVLT